MNEGDNESFPSIPESNLVVSVDCLPHQEEWTGRCALLNGPFLRYLIVQKWNPSCFAPSAVPFMLFHVPSVVDREMHRPLQILSL
jgi:hypothetical protein